MSVQLGSGGAGGAQGGTFTPTQQNIYNAVKAILVHNSSVTADDTDYELDLASAFTPSKSNLYAAVKAILVHSASSATADDANNEIDIPTGGGSGGGRARPFYNGYVLGTYTRSNLADTAIPINSFKWAVDNKLLIRGPKDAVLKIAAGDRLALFVGTAMYQVSVTSATIGDIGTTDDIVNIVTTVERGTLANLAAGASAEIRLYSAAPIGIWDRDINAGALGTGEIQWDTDDHRDLFVSNTDKYGKNAKTELDGIANDDYLGIGLTGYAGLWAIGKKTGNSAGSQQAFLTFVSDNATVPASASGQELTLYTWSASAVPATIQSSTLISPEALTKENVFNAVKSIMVHSASVATADDANREIDIVQFTPSKTNIYSAVKAILDHSGNTGVTADDTNSELDIAQFSPSKTNIYSAVKAILDHTGNRYVSADDTNSELDLGHAPSRQFFAGERLAGVGGDFGRSNLAAASIPNGSFRWETDGTITIHSTRELFRVRVGDYLSMEAYSGNLRFLLMQITDVTDVSLSAASIRRTFTVTLVDGTRDWLAAAGNPQSSTKYRILVHSFRPISYWERVDESNFTEVDDGEFSWGAGVDDRELLIKIQDRYSQSQETVLNAIAVNDYVGVGFSAVGGGGSVNGGHLFGIARVIGKSGLAGGRLNFNLEFPFQGVPAYYSGQLLHLYHFKTVGNVPPVSFAVSDYGLPVSDTSWLSGNVLPVSAPLIGTRFTVTDTAGFQKNSYEMRRTASGADQNPTIGETYKFDGQHYILEIPSYPAEFATTAEVTAGTATDKVMSVKQITDGITGSRSTPNYVAYSFGTFTRVADSNDVDVDAGEFKWELNTSLVIHSTYDNILKIKPGSFIRLKAGTSNYGFNVTTVGTELTFSTTDVSKALTGTIESGYAARSTLTAGATNVEIIYYDKKPTGIWNRVNTAAVATGQFGTSDSSDYEELWLHATDAIGVNHQTTLNSLQNGDYVWFGISGYAGVMGLGALTYKAVTATLVELNYLPEQDSNIPFATGQEIAFYHGKAHEVPEVLLSKSQISPLAVDDGKVSDATAGTPVASDMLLFSDESVDGDPNRKATISDILALDVSSDSVFNTGTSTTQVPNVQQVTVAVDGVRPLNVGWNGQQGSPTSTIWANPAVRKGTTTGTPFNGTQMRWTLSDNSAGDYNLNWKSDSLDWTRSYVAFRLFQNAGNWAANLYLASSNDTIVNDGTIRSATNGLLLWMGRPSTATGDSFDTNRWNFFLVSSANTGSGVVQNPVALTTSDNITVDLGVTKHHVEVNLGDGPHDFLLTIFNRRVELYITSGTSGVVAPVCAWNLTAAQAGQLEGVHYGIAGDGNNVSSKRIYLYNIFVGALNVEQAWPGYTAVNTGWQMPG